MVMTLLHGTVKNGVIVLEKGSQLPEGAQVDIRASSDAPLSEEILKFSGTMSGPSDFARNHDHYIHGTKKRDT
jgi:hypothetical protein